MISSLYSFTTLVKLVNEYLNDVAVGGVIVAETELISMYNQIVQCATWTS